jgi:hypothetical protein
MEGLRDRERRRIKVGVDLGQSRYSAEGEEFWGKVMLASGYMNQGVNICEQFRLGHGSC